MTTARDLVNAIQSGKSATIQATFDSLMAEKVQLGIEAYRQAVIDNTFNPELVSESTEEDESALDSSISEDVDLSEYSLEEIQDFMESEEFSTLDELSKSTLASYVKKASSNMASATRAAGVEAGARGPNRYTRMANKENRAQKRSNGISKAVDKLAKD